MMPLYCRKGHENPQNGRFCLLCGEKLPLPVGQGIYPGLVLGERYRMVRELGHGGFGRTYLAEDLNRFNETCVLKEFAPQVQGTYALQKAEELFSREAGVLYKLQHPQIPKFRELFRVKHQDKGYLFLVQDFVEGQTYRAILDARKQEGLRFNEGEVTQLILQVLPILHYIHAQGVIHRDISPDNLIWRSTDGLPVLIDFGGVKQLAVTVASQFVTSQNAGAAPPIATRLGKVGYAPPEQMQGGIVRPHSDLYALAATVLVLLTGKEPQQLIDPLTLRWDWQREVNLSLSFGNILDKMLQPYPNARFAHASEVLQALTTTPTPVAFPPTLPPLPPTEATLAVAPPPVMAPVNSPVATSNPIPSPTATDNKSLGLMGKILLVFGLIVVAGSFGWLAGNLFLLSQSKPKASKPQPTASQPSVSPKVEPTVEPSPEFSAEELRRKEALQQRRVALNIRHSFYTDLVNEEFWIEYPEQQGRTLGTGPEDTIARAQWDAIASDLLKQLDQANLSEAARRQLGSFRDADLARAKAQANQLRLSSRTLYDMADAKFFLAFPQQKDKKFLNKPIGQVWQAMVFDVSNAVKTSNAFKQIAFDAGQTSKQLSNSLKPGEGIAYIAKLSAGQVMTVNLATSQNALFSIYSPSGKTTILEDSRDRSWSGKLPESGFYEFVVVSDASDPISYQLDLTVENSVLPQALPSASPESSPSVLPQPSPVKSAL
jgi:serine/threonine-protein kinase